VEDGFRAFLICGAAADGFPRVNLIIDGSSAQLARRKMS
jgi:hypothetical protein